MNQTNLNISSTYPPGQGGTGVPEYCQPTLASTDHVSINIRNRPLTSLKSHQPQRPIGCLSLRSVPQEVGCQCNGPTCAEEPFPCCWSQKQVPPSNSWPIRWKMLLPPPPPSVTFHLPQNADAHAQGVHQGETSR